MSTTNKKELQKEHFKTNKTPNKITICLQTNAWVMWLKLLGSKFFDPKKQNASILAGTNHLVKDRCRKSGSIQECFLTKLAPVE